MTYTADSMDALRGGCYCGNVRYEATGEPFHATSCHCSICRHVSGAAFVTWFSIQRAEFIWIHGRAASFASTAKGTRTFCPMCSTPLTFQHADYPDELDITLCSLDDPTALAPKDHTFVSNRLAWIQLADNLPEYWEVREEHRSAQQVDARKRTAETSRSDFDVRGSSALATPRRAHHA